MVPIEHLCCQYSDCPQAGVRGGENLYFRGWSGKSRRIRMVYCRTCKRSFSERKGTVLEQARLPDDKALAILRLLLALVPGKRDGAACERLIRQVRDRTGGRTDVLLTSDEHAPYETAVRQVYGVETPRPRRPGPGRPPRPAKVIPADLCYATVRKRRERGRVVEVVRTLVFGTLYLLGGMLKRSSASM